LYPPRIERAGKRQKNPFKSVAYQNEKHSRSSYIKRMQRKSGAANDKKPRPDGARLSEISAAAYKR
jgi:hypothetical protein